MDDIDTYRRILTRVAARTKDPMLKLISDSKSMDNVVKASLTLLSAIFNVYVGYTILDIPTPMPRIIQGSRVQQEEPT